MRQSQRLDKIPPYLFAEIDRKIADKKRSDIPIPFARTSLTSERAIE